MNTHVTVKSESYCPVIAATVQSSRRLLTGQTLTPCWICMERILGLQTGLSHRRTTAGRCYNREERMTSGAGEAYKPMEAIQGM
jgi:hypothetical protein